MAKRKTADSAEPVLDAAGRPIDEDVLRAHRLPPGPPSPRDLELEAARKALDERKGYSA